MHIIGDYVVFADNKIFQPMVILSASMDKTMMIWEFDQESGVWMDTVNHLNFDSLAPGQNCLLCDFSKSVASMCFVDLTLVVV